MSYQQAPARNDWLLSNPIYGVLVAVLSNGVSLAVLEVVVLS